MTHGPLTKPERDQLRADLDRGPHVPGLVAAALGGALVGVAVVTGVLLLAGGWW